MGELWVMTLEYTLDRTKIHEMVDSRVSQTAAMEYGEDGGEPLFDSIIVHSNERVRIEDYMLSSLAALVGRNIGEASLGVDGDGNDVVTLHVPDFNETLERRVYDLIDAFVADRCTALWMRRVCKDREEEWAQAANGGLDAVSQMIHTRKRPQRVKL